MVRASIILSFVSTKITDSVIIILGLGLGLELEVELGIGIGRMLQ